MQAPTNLPTSTQVLTEAISWEDISHDSQTRITRSQPEEPARIVGIYLDQTQSDGRDTNRPQVAASDTPHEFTETMEDTRYGEPGGVDSDVDLSSASAGIEMIVSVEELEFIRILRARNGMGPDRSQALQPLQSTTLQGSEQTSFPGHSSSLLVRDPNLPGFVGARGIPTTSNPNVPTRLAPSVFRGVRDVDYGESQIGRGVFNSIIGNQIIVPPGYDASSPALQMHMMSMPVYPPGTQVTPSVGEQAVQVRFGRARIGAGAFNAIAGNSFVVAD